MLRLLELELVLEGPGLGMAQLRCRRCREGLLCYRERHPGVVPLQDVALVEVVRVELVGGAVEAAVEDAVETAVGAVVGAAVAVTVAVVAEGALGPVEAGSEVGVGIREEIQRAQMGGVRGLRRRRPRLQLRLPWQHVRLTVLGGSRVWGFFFHPGGRTL